VIVSHGERADLPVRKLLELPVDAPVDAAVAVHVELVEVRVDEAELVLIDDELVWMLVKDEVAEGG